MLVSPPAPAPLANTVPRRRQCPRPRPRHVPASARPGVPPACRLRSTVTRPTRPPAHMATKTTCTMSAGMLSQRSGDTERVPEQDESTGRHDEAVEGGELSAHGGAQVQRRQAGRQAHQLRAALFAELPAERLRVDTPVRQRRQPAPGEHRLGPTGHRHAHDPECRRHVRPAPETAPLVAASQNESQEEGQARPDQDPGVDQELAEVVDPVGERRPGRASAGDRSGFDVSDQEHDGAAHHMSIDRRHRVVRHVGTRPERGRQRGRQGGRRRMAGAHLDLLAGGVQDDQAPGIRPHRLVEVDGHGVGYVYQMRSLRRRRSRHGGVRRRGRRPPHDGQATEKYRPPTVPAAASSGLPASSDSVLERRRQDWRSQKPTASVRSVFPGQ